MRTVLRVRVGVRAVLRVRSEVRTVSRYVRDNADLLIHFQLWFDGMFEG